MSRDITLASQTAAEAPQVRPVTMAHLALDIDPVFVNSSDRNLIYSGNTYLGVGRLGSITGISESSSLQASTLKLTLTGIPAEYVTMAMEQKYQGREVTIYQAFFSDSYTLIADPILQWSGTIDQMSIVLGDSAAISITAQSKLIRWETPKIRRYTDADQQAAFPGDLGLQFVPQTVEREILWGRVRARQ